MKKEPYLAVYNLIDPRTGERLPGRAPGGYARFAEILKRKLEAEPHATQERYLQLEREAAQETRRSPVYTDITIAHNKSVSVLHASFREQARRARLAGDTRGEALWRAREERVQEILQEANHAALEWMQQQAGFTRTGYHGSRVDGVEPGRWARALPVVTTWLQGTNRDGEPHDHSHNVIARMALTESDGVWRAVDTMALREQLGAMAGIVESRVYSALAREFGVTVRKRDDGRGHEIEGIAQQTLDAYSTRAQTVTRKAAALARQWAQKYGREPNAREMLFITDEANLASRQGKDDELIDWDALTAKWDATVGGELAAIAETVCDFHARPDGAAPSREVQAQVIEEALARVQASRSTWTRSDLMRSIAWSMGQEFCGMTPDARQDLLVALTEAGPGSGLRRGVPGGAGMAARATVAGQGPRRPQRLHPARHHPLRHPRATGHGRAHVPAGATPRRTRVHAAVLRNPARRRRKHAGRAARRKGARRNATDANRVADGPGRHDLRGAHLQAPRLRRRRPGRLGQDAHRCGWRQSVGGGRREGDRPDMCAGRQGRARRCRD